MTGYNQDRVNKISQIMPQFSKVAKAGDTVLMGLEGDPLFPSKYGNSRPSATITRVEERENESFVHMQLSNGETKQVSSLSLSPEDVWEFDDHSFKNVLERQAGTSKDNVNYRGTSSSEMVQLREEVNSLKELLDEERYSVKQFQNTVIASMNEMAADICKLDTSGKNTEFCRTLSSEYTKMVNRAENSLSAPPSPKSPEYKGIQDDFSADDTDFF